MLSSARHPRFTLAATQLVCEGSAFFRNLVLARLVGAEIAIVLAASAILCAVVTLAVYQYSGDLVRALFVR